MKNSRTMKTALILFALCGWMMSPLSAQLKVVANGNVGIGVNDPGAAKLKTRGTSQLEFGLDAQAGNADFTMQLQGITKSQFRYNGSLGGIEILADNSNNGSTGLDPSDRVMFISGLNSRVHIGGTNPQAALDVEGTVHYSGSIMNTSDKRLKKDITDFDEGLKQVLALRPVSYSYNGKANTDASEKHIGLIAQELQKVSPNLVGTFEHIEYARQTPNQITEEADFEIEEVQEYLNIKESAIKYLLINAIQEQQGMIDKQNEQIKILSRKVERLSKVIANIELNNTEENKPLHKESISTLGKAYPNPSTSLSTFIPCSIEKTALSASLVITNINGQIVFQQDIDERGPSSVIELRTGHMSKGTYNYSLVVDEEIIDTYQLIIAE